MTTNNIVNSPNTFGTLGPFIVGLDSNSNYGTIQSAIDAAVAAGAQDTHPINVFIKPGTYTEDLNWTAQVNLISFQNVIDPQAVLATVVIGSHTLTILSTNTQFYCDGIDFQLQSSGGGPTGGMFNFVGSTAPISVFSNCRMSNVGQTFPIFVFGNSPTTTTTLNNCSVNCTANGYLYSVPLSVSTTFNMTINNSYLTVPSLSVSGTTAIPTATTNIVFNYSTIIGNSSHQLINGRNHEIQNFTFNYCTTYGLISNISVACTFNFNYCVLKDNMTIGGSAGSNAIFNYIKCTFEDVATLISTTLAGSYLTMDNCLMVLANQLVQVDKTTPSSVGLYFSRTFNYSTHVNYYTTTNGTHSLLTISIPTNSTIAIQVLACGRTGNTAVTPPTEAIAGVLTTAYVQPGPVSVPAPLYIDNKITSKAGGGSSVTVTAPSNNTISINAVSANAPTNGVAWSAVINWQIVINGD